MAFYNMNDLTNPKSPLIGPINFVKSLNINALLNLFQQIGKIPDEQIINALKTNYSDIFREANIHQDSKLLKVLTDPIFLKLLNIAISSINYSKIKPKDKIFGSKICYDYIKLPKDRKNKEVEEQIILLAIALNKDIINYLTRYIPQEFAIYIAISRRSSTEDLKCANRVNKTLLNSTTELSEQDIINIYSCIFSTKFTPLFEAVMMVDALPSYATPLQERIYSNIELAILDILDSMPSVEIRIVLLYYSGDWIFKGKPRVRFSMHAIATITYSRICDIVNQLQQENIYIP